MYHPSYFPMVNSTRRPSAYQGGAHAVSSRLIDLTAAFKIHGDTTASACHSLRSCERSAKAVKQGVLKAVFAMKRKFAMKERF